jgi:hypothetical protein
VKIDLDPSTSSGQPYSSLVVVGDSGGSIVERLEDLQVILPNSLNGETSALDDLHGRTVTIRVYLICRVPS